MLLVYEFEELVPLRDRVSTLGGAEELFRVAWCLETRIAGMIKGTTKKHVATAAVTCIVAGCTVAKALQELQTHLVGIS